MEDIIILDLRDVKLNYRRDPSYIEKRAGTPKERWKWAFASVRASAEKYAKTSAVRAVRRLVLVDRADWRPAEGRIDRPSRTEKGRPVVLRIQTQTLQLAPDLLNATPEPHFVELVILDDDCARKNMNSCFAWIENNFRL